MKAVKLLLLIAGVSAIHIKNIYKDDDEEDTTGGIVDEDLISNIRVDAGDI